MGVISWARDGITRICKDRFKAGEIETEAERLTERTAALDAQTIERVQRETKRLVDRVEAVKNDLDEYEIAYQRFRPNEEVGNAGTSSTVPKFHALDVGALRSNRHTDLKWLGDPVTGVLKGAIGGTSAAYLAYGFVGLVGNASTGTAITTLSGAAAKSATLAWLGGGALKAGGAGVVGGVSLLAIVVAAPAIAWGAFEWAKSSSKSKLKSALEKLKGAESYERVVRDRLEKLIEPLLANCQRLEIVLASLAKVLRRHSRHLRKLSSNWFIELEFIDRQRFEDGTRVANSIVDLVEMPLVSVTGELDIQCGPKLERAEELLEEVARRQSWLSRIFETVLAVIGLR